MAKTETWRLASAPAKGRVVSLTPVRLGRFADVRFEEEVKDNLARIEQHKQATRRR